MDAALDRKINEFVERVRALLPVRMIVLYGSYAKGTERSGSDVDIAVIVDSLHDSWLSVNRKLFLLSGEIDPIIEPNLIIARNNNGEFLESILRYGKVLYQDPKAA